MSSTGTRWRVPIARPAAVLALLAAVLAGCGVGGGSDTDPSPSRSTSPAASPTFQVEEGVSYGPHPAQVVDVYSPVEGAPVPGAADDGRPAVLLVHGGGWGSGSRTHYDNQAAILARSGWVAVTVDYRLAEDGRYPAAEDDVAAALDLVVSRADDWDVDLDRVVLVGDSAGGHLAMLTALGDGPAVAGVIGLSGIYDLAQVARTVRGTEHAWLAELIRDHLDCAPPRTLADCSTTATAASPVGLASPDDPPTLLVHATDELVPLADAEAMHDALADAGVDVRLVTVPGSEHGVNLLDDANPEVRAFLEAIAAG